MRDFRYLFPPLNADYQIMSPVLTFTSMGKSPNVFEVCKG